MSNRKYITEYRESLFADLGLWSFKFMRTLSLSSLSQRLCHMFFVCVIFVVMRLLFFFSSQSSLVLDAVDSEQGVQGLLGTEAISLSFYGACGKSRGYEISAKRLYSNTVSWGFDCHRSILSPGSTRERSEDRF